MVGNPFPVGEGVAPYAKGQSTVIAETGPAEVVDLEGTVGNGTVSRPARGSVEAVPDRGGVGGWSMNYTIWYQVVEGGLYSRVEVTRLDDAQAIWDILAARGRLMRSARP